MSETRIVNLKFAEYDIYIGRKGKGEEGYFGNPFLLLKGLPKGTTLGSYKIYFYRRLETDKEFKRRVHELKGKTLGCFCKPNPCHGDIIKEYLDNI